MAPLSRRDFLGRSGSCAAHLALAAAAFPPAWRRWWAATPRGRVVVQEPFGRLERVADGVWALISTPLTGDRTTLANGGIVAGRTGVLAIEGFYQPTGAAWLAAQARALTGQWPTHVALTHYHADHTNGVAGYVTDARHPVIQATATTRDLALDRNQPPVERRAAVRDVLVLSPTAPTSLDLGDRVVRLVPRDGHTPSDLSCELDDPSVVFCGDLVWHDMFPNFVDAMPGRLHAAVQALRRGRETTYVPGHGPLGGETDFDRYVAVLDEVERAARRAHADGVEAATAAAAFALPPSLGEWVLFGRTFYERAFTAWYRELSG